MRYLHCMVRVSCLDKAMAFYCDALGLIEHSRREHDAGRFTLVFLTAADDQISSSHSSAPLLELTYNWDAQDYVCGRNFGHLAYSVKDIYSSCRRLLDGGVTLNRPPRDGRMAFVRSPDNISIELLQQGTPLELIEPWVSMPNQGEW